jgi:hypothetical protein
MVGPLLKQCRIGRYSDLDISVTLKSRQCVCYAILYQ